jgi:hypothetical protein
MEQYSFRGFFTILAHQYFTKFKIKKHAIVPRRSYVASQPNGATNRSVMREQ